MSSEEVDCVDIENEGAYPEHSSGVRAAVITVHAIIFLTALFGNAAIVYTTARTRALQNIQNMLIVNLAVASICVTTLALPYTSITSLYKRWYFGRGMCQLIPLVQGGSILVTSLSLCVIALDRYLLICHPHLRLFNKRRVIGGSFD